MDRQNLIEYIKKKKELSGLADSIVSHELDHVMHPFKHELSKKEIKIIIKETRARLRYLSGQFVKQSSSYKEKENNRVIMKRLVDQYGARIILDIGSGLNPLQIARPGLVYYAYDINEAHIKSINDYFKKKKITGEARVLDARNPNKYPQADIAFLLKLVDLLDSKGHKCAEQLLVSLPTPILVVSFATKTITGKPMRHPQRGWIERLCTRLGYTCELLKTPYELFYLIRKH